MDGKNVYPQWCDRAGVIFSSFFRRKKELNAWEKGWKWKLMDKNVSFSSNYRQLFIHLHHSGIPNQALHLQRSIFSVFIASSLTQIFCFPSWALRCQVIIANYINLQSISVMLDNFKNLFHVSRRFLLFESADEIISMILFIILCPKLIAFLSFSSLKTIFFFVYSLCFVPCFCVKCPFVKRKKAKRTRDNIIKIRWYPWTLNNSSWDNLILWITLWKTFQTFGKSFSLLFLFLFSLTIYKKKPSKCHLYSHK